MSKALIQKLNQSCSAMRFLEIQYADLNEFVVTDLPISLEQLSLVRCEIPIRWFKGTALTNLCSIDLSSSSRICSTHLKDLAGNCKNTLKELKLKNCYRIDDKALEVIVDEEFNRIESLDLQGISRFLNFYIV